MTDNNQNAAAGSKAPTHIAYAVRNREGETAIWTRIGAPGQMPMAKASTSNWKLCRWMAA